MLECVYVLRVLPKQLVHRCNHTNVVGSPVFDTLLSHSLTYSLMHVNTNFVSTDPKLPLDLYYDVLVTMLKEVEELEHKATKSEEDPIDYDNNDKTDYRGLFDEARQRYMHSLLQWGSTHALRESITFHKTMLQQFQNEGADATNPHLEDIEKSLYRRLTQSAVGYLELDSSESKTDKDGQQQLQLPEATLMIDSVSDSLFPLDDLLVVVQDGINQDSSTRTGLETLAVLHLVATNYRRSLRCFLSIANEHTRDLLDEDIGKEALRIALDETGHSNEADLFGNDHDKDNSTATMTTTATAASPSQNSLLVDDRYGFVLGMIEHRHLHQCLLEEDLFAEFGRTDPPLLSLIRLVGLEPVGDFLIEHCVQPVKQSVAPSSEGIDGTNNAMPLDAVAKQFEDNKSILFWYLELVFERKPEVYVTFPDTAVPPRVVTDLHRVHLDLHIEYTKERNSAKALSGTEAYNLGNKTTPLLSFLKVRITWTESFIREDACLIFHHISSCTVFLTDTCVFLLSNCTLSIGRTSSRRCPSKGSPTDSRGSTQSQ